MATHHDEQIIQANGIEICTDAYGDRNDPAILLIMGAMASMIQWEEPFCQRLADGGRFVIRFDNRDTGRTACCPPGEPNYSLHDMADDAVAVLDHYGIEKAHIAGASMGGMITQLVGLNHPDRVLSLILIESTPDPGVLTDAIAGKTTTGALSPPTDAVIALATAMDRIDWSDRAAVVGYQLEGNRILAGTAHPYDEAGKREMLGREFDRAVNIASSQNHGLAVTATEPWHHRLETIRAPTLVIHGTEDPIVPFDHALAMADGIPGAKLLAQPGVGHDLPPEEFDTIVPAILEFTSSANRS